MVDTIEQEIARSSIKAAKSSAKENAKRSRKSVELAPWFCIVFRVCPELHLDNCTSNDSKIRPVAIRSIGN